MTTIKLKIESMGCQACVGRVIKAIEKVGGARPVSVAVGSATVELDAPNATPAAVIEAVTKAGYPASMVAT